MTRIVTSECAHDDNSLISCLVLSECALRQLKHTGTCFLECTVRQRICLRLDKSVRPLDFPSVSFHQYIRGKNVLIWLVCIILRRGLVNIELNMTIQKL